MIALSLLTLLAAPEPVTAAVLPQLVLEDGAELGPANVLRAIEHATLRRPTVRAVSAAAIDVLAGSEQRLRDCGPDASCVGAILRDAGVPLGLLVVVNTRISPPVIAVRAVVDGDVRAEHIDSRVSIEQPLADAITRTVGLVLDALAHPEWAQISVDLSPVGATLRVEPEGALWRSPNVALLRPGAWRVRAEAPGHEPSMVELELRAAEERTVSLALEPEVRWWSSPWLWGVVGVAVAGGAAITAVTLSAERCLCVGHPSAPCECR